MLQSQPTKKMDNWNGKNHINNGSKWAISCGNVAIIRLGHLPWLPATHVAAWQRFALPRCSATVQQHTNSKKWLGTWTRACRLQFNFAQAPQACVFHVGFIAAAFGFRFSKQMHSKSRQEGVLPSWQSEMVRLKHWPWKCYAAGLQPTSSV